VIELDFPGRKASDYSLKNYTNAEKNVCQDTKLLRRKDHLEDPGEDVQ
jgi:hypothetical protein